MIFLNLHSLKEQKQEKNLQLVVYTGMSFICLHAVVDVKFLKRFKTRSERTDNILGLKTVFLHSDLMWFKEILVKR